MEDTYKELDEVKAEMEKLKAEFQIKTDLLKSTKKAHNEQLIKFQDAKLQIKKQAQELNAKSMEISEAKKIYEDLQSCLHKEELAVRHLSSANDKLRADCSEKVRKLEGDNKELLVALDEATLRNKDFEQKNCACIEEISGLKRLLSVSERKCFEAEQRAQSCKELSQREDTIAKLEEEHSHVQDQLKWKKEQFKHLEEAHQNVQKQFCTSKEEWKREKLALLEEISSLQTSLDSQTRISEGLHTQLTMCNQALAHEESRRKLLEVQVSETQSLFEDVYSKCQEAQSKIESLSFQRDEDIAKLRNLLGTKDMLFKEMEFKIIHLERDNQELHGSLKELQEAQINNAGAATSLTKLRNKLRCLEQVHSSCSINIKARESEWKCQLGKMEEEMNSYLAQLKVKDSQILELQKELEGCQFSLELQEELEDCQFSRELLNEEMAVVLLVVKSEFSEACSKLHVDIERKRKEVESLVKEVEFEDHIKEEKFLMEKELKTHTKMLEESSKSQHHLEGQVFQMGNALKDVSDALIKESSELAKQICETNLIEFELQKWKCTAESLKLSLEEKHETQTHMEASLLAQVDTNQTLKQENESLLCIVKERDIVISNLQQQIASLESRLAVESEAMEAFKQGQENSVRIVKEKDRCIDKLQKEIAELELVFITKEFEGTILARLDAEKTFEHEKERLLQVIKEKDQSIKDLLVRSVLLEEDFTDVVISSFSEVTEKQIVIDMLREALNEAKYLTTVKIQQNNTAIAELGKEISNLQQKVEFQEKSLCCSKQETEQLKDLLEAKNAEVDILTDQFGNEKRTSEVIVKELEFGKGVLLEDNMKLSSERKDILTHMERDCDWIDNFCHEDARLMGMLTKILRVPEENGRASDLTVSNELCSSPEKNATVHISPTAWKFKVNTDDRSPLREINNDSSLTLERKPNSLCNM